MSSFDDQVAAVQTWFDSPRFEGLRRLYTARQVVEQRGTIAHEYTVARDAAAAFHERLRQMFSEGKSITTFGPYSPGQGVAIKRKGIEGIYVGGWATSAKGSATEDPGPDLASYPLSQVPDEAAVLVRALLTADRNQQFLRSRMSDEERARHPACDFRPFIIADADTGHGGDPHVRNLIRRFVEAGVPGYHIEDQRPGTKKCGHQGGKVLVASDEQIKRLNAARFQLDVMGVPGIIVARTDAEAATLLDGRSDERDQPFVLGATHRNIPAYKAAYLALIRRFHSLGVEELNGHLLYAVSDAEYAGADEWLEHTGLAGLVTERVAECSQGTLLPRVAFDQVATRLVELWEAAAGLETYAEAVAHALEFLAEENEALPMTAQQWRAFASGVSYHDAREKARSLGVTTYWNSDEARTPEGFYQVRGGIAYAIAKSLAVAPFADVLWMETKTADLEDARTFADAIHAVYPNKMLAYNLSPSFNWDSTGMSDDDMMAFPSELGKMGFVFNFITYGGHQIDGVAAEEFATELQREGMLALARLQRKIRLLESPYRTPQTLVGGPRLDAALSASSGRTATTKAMGKGSTQTQHLVQTEVPKRLLEEWLGLWSEQNKMTERLRVELLPQRSGSEVLELAVRGEESRTKIANVVFLPIHDRRDRSILSVRDQNTFDEKLRMKRLMTLLHLYLVHRYKSDSVHYVSPTEDNQHQTASMKELGIFADVNTEVGEIIVADVNQSRVAKLVTDRDALMGLIRKDS